MQQLRLLSALCAMECAQVSHLQPGNTDCGHISLDELNQGKNLN